VLDHRAHHREGGGGSGVERARHRLRAIRISRGERAAGPIGRIVPGALAVEVPGVGELAQEPADRDLGARREPVSPPDEARAIAIGAAAAVGGDLVGIDLLPSDLGTWVVLEVNGAVDFNGTYALGDDVFAEVREALGSRALVREEPAA